MFFGRDVFPFLFVRFLLFCFLTHFVLDVSVGVVGDKGLWGDRSSYLYCNTVIFTSFCVHNIGPLGRTRLINTLHIPQPNLALLTVS